MPYWLYCDTKHGGSDRTLSQLVKVSDFIFWRGPDGWIIILKTGATNFARNSPTDEFGFNRKEQSHKLEGTVYQQQWKNYAIVSQLDKQPEEYCVALFLYSIGTEAVKTYNSFDMTEENRRKLSEIMIEFDKYAIGETNETYERYMFNSRNQKEGESIDKYVTELLALAQTCGFCTCLNDSLIRDRIEKRLFRQPKLTLQKCIEIAKSEDVSSTQLKLQWQSHLKTFIAFRRILWKNRRNLCENSKQRNMTPTAIKYQQSRAPTVE